MTGRSHAWKQLQVTVILVVNKHQVTRGNGEMKKICGRDDGTKQRSDTKKQRNDNTKRRVEHFVRDLTP